MAESELTVILPCAGEGSRLGLNFPKPLFEVLPGVRLIDLTLHHLRQASRNGVKYRLVVVVKPRSAAVYEYVAQSLEEISVKCCFFDDQFHEWPGSVYSANPFFGEYNVVLLPDSLLTVSEETPFLDDRGKGVLELMELGLLKRPVHFLAVMDSSPRLSRLGAIRAEMGEVKLLSDKPSGDLSLFNCFWACYGFRKSHGEALYSFLDDVLAKRVPSLPLNALGPPGVDFVFAYRDLGSWEEIEGFRLTTATFLPEAGR